jgi:hypothetical protein
MKNRLILEFSEFNLQRYNSDSRMVSVGTTTDPTLSVNAFDRHEDSIRVGMSRVTNIMKSLSNSNAYKSLKQKLTFEQQTPSSIKILRIIPDNVNYSVYLSTVINEMEYDGVIKDILSKNPVFNTNIFKSESLVQSEEWQIRLKGLIIESIKKWLNIEPNKYTLLNEKVDCFNTLTGGIKTITKGTTIDVLNTSVNENRITIKIDNEVYNLTKDNFIYFNYWFEKSIKN